MDQLEKSARKWMFSTLNFGSEDYLDCGDINTTKLAEDCANALELFEDDDGEVIHEWVFDVAHDVSDEWLLAEENENDDIDDDDDDDEEDED